MGTRLEGRAAVGHLLRRAAFGATPSTLERLTDRSYEDVVEELLGGLDGPPPVEPEGFDPYSPGSMQQLWLERMAAGEAPLAERLALFWHGHFATSNAKVQDGQLMWNQYRLFRSAGGGRFGDLVLGVSRDVAMIRWLDGNANRAGQANENYARELQELFTLGIGNYTERDVREVARAFTGWGSRHHRFVFNEAFHDRGQKSIHGTTGDLDGTDVVEILVGLPACHRFVARNLLTAFSHPDPTDGQVEALARVFADADGDLRATLRALLLDPAFTDAGRQRCLVKGPVEFAISALGAAGFATVPPWVQPAIDRMGQILFRPPSVKGWTSGVGWLSSAAVVERLRFARKVADAAPMAAAGWIVDVAFDGAVPDRLAAALEGVRGRDRVALVLGSPDFQLA